MKKFAGVLIFLFSYVTLVSAYISDPIYGLGYGMNQLIILFENFLGPFFAVILGGGELLFERILFLFIILAVVFSVLRKMDAFNYDDNRVIVWIITIAVSLLSTRFLVESDLVLTMLLPYTAFGVILTSALPFVIYAYFVLNLRESPTTRKILWIFFIVGFLGVWGTRFEELGNISWIYFITMVLAVLFLLFDGSIQRWLIKQEREAGNLASKEMHLAELNKQLKELRKALVANPGNKLLKQAEKELIRNIKRVAKSKY